MSQNHPADILGCFDDFEFEDSASNTKNSEKNNLTSNLNHISKSIFGIDKRVPFDKLNDAVPLKIDIDTIDNFQSVFENENRFYQNSNFQDFMYNEYLMPIQNGKKANNNEIDFEPNILILDSNDHEDPNINQTYEYDDTIQYKVNKKRNGEFKNRSRKEKSSSIHLNTSTLEENDFVYQNLSLDSLQNPDLNLNKQKSRKARTSRKRIQEEKKGDTNRSKLFWTSEMDKFLKEAYNKYQDSGIGMWTKIADYVTDKMNEKQEFFLNEIIISNHQCAERFKHHVDPSLAKRKKGPWTDEEVKMLKKLALENQSIDKRTGNSRQYQVNWTKVSSILNRHYRDCQHKWININKYNKKTGPFTEDENARIIAMVSTLGEIPECWIQLGNDLNRSINSIIENFNSIK